MALPRKVMRLTCRTLFYQRQDKWAVSSWCRLSFNIFRHKSSESEASQTSWLEKDKPGSYKRNISHSIVDQVHQLENLPDQPDNAKKLNLTIIGPPNAGKSTLANQLTGWKVSAVSQKINTTKQNISSVYSEGDVQIVVKDTPGVTGRKARKRLKIEKALKEVSDHGLNDSDLICVIIDAGDDMHVHNLDPGIRNLLEKYKHIPSFLVLNKVDLVKVKPDLLSYVWTLTNGVVNGRPLPSVKNREKWTKRKVLKEKMFDKMDAKLQKDPKYSDKFLSDLENKENNETSVINDTAYNNQTDDEQLHNSENIVSEASENRDGTPTRPDRSKLTLYTQSQFLADQLKPKRLPGWPHFEEVFMLSALYDRGVKAVGDYLNEKAQEGDWSYHSSVVTVHSPEELAKQCVWSAVLEYASKEVPYRVYPIIEDWGTYPDGTIRISMVLNTHSVRQYSDILGPTGETYRNICETARENLMDLFRTTISLQLQVLLQGTMHTDTTGRESNKKSKHRPS